MANIERLGYPCQPNHIEAQAGPTTPATVKPYRLDRSRKFIAPKQADDLDSWVRLAEETFSSPSKEERGEKVSLFGVDRGHVKSSPALGVSVPPDIRRAAPLPRGRMSTGREGTARRVPGVYPATDHQRSTLLDYRLTQGENKKNPFEKTWTGYTSSVNDTYHFRAVIAGHIIKLYKYGDLQVCQKGKICKGRQKREDRTEEEKQRDRKRNLWRARNALIDTINANVDRPWGERLKFFTMSFKDDIFDLKEANSQFNKFIKRLEYDINRKVHYTVIARFQDGKRPGGKVGGREGVIHYHVLFYDLPYVPHDKLTGIWGRGFVWINAVDDVDNLGVYMVAGYMGNEIDDERLNGQKHYWSSRGLSRAVVMYGTEDLSAKLGIQGREPVKRKTFISEYIGVITYEQYNLKREGKDYERKKRYRASGIGGSSGSNYGTPWAGVGLVSLLSESIPERGSAVGLQGRNLPVRL
jgi:hypothetical protein